jgi:Mrp family chromosome partitioning ATPase
VDADMRGRDGWRRSGPGLSDILLGRTTLQETLVETTIRGLHLMGRGAANEGIDALASNVLQDVIDEMRQRFDAIVIDSPPLASVSDAFLLAYLADRTILVVNGASTPEVLVEDNVSLFRELSIPITGAVITGVEESEFSRLPARHRDRYLTGPAPDNGRMSPFPAVHSRGGGHGRHIDMKETGESAK